MPALFWTFLLRHALLLTLLGSVFTVLAALAFERITGLLPCPLCWIQRWIFIGFAGLSLVALFAQRWLWARWLLMVLFALLAATGVGVALRHLYIKLNPQMVSCGMDVDMLLDFFPLREALMHMLAGSADCAQQANFLGLPLPSWTLAGYLLLGALAIFGLYTGRRTL